MQAVPLVALTVAALLLLLASASAAPGPLFAKGQTKPRTIRGFKNVVLSTARNFGKRAGAGPPGLADGEYVDEASIQANAADYQRPPANSFPVQWFIEEIQSNPELARSVVRKFIDENQDGELSAEELLRPMY